MREQNEQRSTDNEQRLLTDNQKKDLKIVENDR